MYNTILAIISQNTILTTVSKFIMTKTKTMMRNQPLNGNFDFIFLLGVISSKWWISHNKKRIRVYLPESKRYLAEALKATWKGTVSTITRPRHRGVMWQTTSTRSLNEIREIAESVKTRLPPEFYQQLSAFMNEHV